MRWYSAGSSTTPRPWQAGLSAIELLVVLTIVLVVGLGIVRSLSWASGQLFSRTDAAMASAAQAQHAINLIRADLGRASSSEGLACGTDVLVMMINHRQVVYFHPATTDPASPWWRTLQRQEAGGFPQTVVSGITTLEAKCAMPGLVTVGLSAQVSRAGFAGQSLTTKVLLQNP